MTGWRKKKRGEEKERERREKYPRLCHVRTLVTTPRHGNNCDVGKNRKYPVVAFTSRLSKIYSDLMSSYQHLPPLIHVVVTTSRSRIYQGTYCPPSAPGGIVKYNLTGMCSR